MSVCDLAFFVTWGLLIMSVCDLAFFVAWGLLIVGFVDREHILHAWLSAAAVAGLSLYFC